MYNFWQKIDKPILALAPMAGITDSAFRQICTKYGADVVYSEMVSVDGLVHNSQKTFDLMAMNKKEGNVVVQIFGKKPEIFSEAVKIVQKYALNRSHLLPSHINHHLINAADGV